jgi:hypothetical protein
MDSMRWTEQSDSGAPTIKNHSVTYFNGKCFVYGGYDGRRNHATLLIYDIHEQRWIRPVTVGNTTDSSPTGNGGGNSNNDAALSGSSIMGDPGYLVQGTPPPGRNGHSATLAADPDDEENGRIIVIGGWLGTGPLAASDMHVLDISNGGRQLRWYQPAIKGTPPGPCNMHSADYVTAQREVYVFRGGNGREYLNDLHALNVVSLTWRKVETNGAIPQQRANHSSSILEETGELFIFGGWNGTERLNDIHILNTKTSNWTCPHVSGVLPHPRAGMTLTALRGRLYLFGGSGTSAKCFQDLQILDRQEMAWLDVNQYEASSNQGRHRYADHNNDLLAENDDARFQFGGHHPFENGQQSSGASYGTHGDPIRFGYGDEIDPARPQQGGTQEGSRAGNIFTSSRADWRSRDMTVRPRPTGPMNASPNPNDEETVSPVLLHGRGPGRRAGHTATAVNRQIYIFGGSCGSDYLNDFFVLDTDPPPHAIVSEPTSLQLLERRLRHFFNDEEFSDVTFVVQGQKVYGHKMVLSIVSDCFRAMFTTGFRESDALEIEIPDCSHSAFLAVMEYIYTGASPAKVEQTSAHPDGDRNLGRVVEILELADRFFLDHLKQICETMLQPVITFETVEYLLAISQKTNASQLQQICEHFLRNRESMV